MNNRDGAALPPARCSRPDTGHQHLAAGVVLVNRILNRRSDERVSPEAGYRCDVAKKLTPLGDRECHARYTGGHPCEVE